jgi:glycosyltransferase involved in cell wall biosynthesis
MSETKTAVVIPAFKVAGHIKDVVESVPGGIDHVVVVDDACPESSGKVAEATGRANLTVLYHEKNLGVGGAMITGYRKALELGADIVIKMDGDGQMDPAYIPKLIEPLANGEADYSKGNRFRDFKKLGEMPRARLIGNSALSFLVKASSGYWNIVDPTNGYTAIHRRALERLDVDRTAKRFFFESDMLINLNIAGAVVQDIGIPARYGDEGSTLRVWKAPVEFLPRLLKGLARRIVLRYFVYDFNMASVYLLLGLPLFLFGVIFGAVEWAGSLATSEPTPLGTIMLAALPVILGLEMLLQAINIDINSVPKKPIS